MLRSRLSSLDRYQRTHAWIGFPLAVLQKYGDDQAGYLAAGVTYYAFFSIFPLLLVFVSVLGFVLRGHPGVEHSILSSALGQFPIIGPQLQAHSLSGSGIGLGLGLTGSLLAGTSVFRAAQNAMDQLWGVPLTSRPNFLQARLRALLLLLVLGVAVLASTALGALGAAGTDVALPLKIGAVVISTLLNFVVFWVAFRTMTTKGQSWRCLRGGAAAAAIGYECLQLAGGYYVNHVLTSASNTYGTFALVIGLLSWIYLAVHVTLLAAEGNVVAERQLWPRSLTLGGQQAASDADKRALRQRAQVEERRHDQRIEVSFTGSAPPETGLEGTTGGGTSAETGSSRG